MESKDCEFIQLELKYCERCGALWLRPRGSEVVFCGTCALAVVEMAKWESGTGVPESVASFEVDDQKAFWIEGGNA